MLHRVLIFFYLNYPGVQKQFVEHEMALLTPEQRAAMEQVQAAQAAAARAMANPAPAAPAAPAARPLRPLRRPPPAAPPAEPGALSVTPALRRPQPAGRHAAITRPTRASAGRSRHVRAPG